ncbi:hypothetical protein GGQ21_002546 [Salinibacter ruber]|jgi:hypothetical protein|uniref:Lipoprotein n=1 Tax=Salinibacter ruber TaxID=146919 RepID=A0A9X2Q9B8_9BACT|nr:hypothetical protein [Salinibacter ruber]MCS3662021.1 hypothetical protein [Salinibacter ruber]MCS3671876.1 hypothetical protein [Salinibacter ruber]MCS3711816.1 hypothetical protein [Salinibacter ruber]MCS4048029.1 hypothetical protein [Salinibacter ruber]MCS4142079.1 hypothetical protein [Salinibacter ruber]
MKTASNIFLTLLWVLAIAGACTGAVITVAVVLNAKGAPQQAAGAATGCAAAIVPYVLARSFSEISDMDWG